MCRCIFLVQINLIINTNYLSSDEQCRRKIASNITLIITSDFALTVAIFYSQKYASSGLSRNVYREVMGVPGCHASKRAKCNTLQFDYLYKLTNISLIQFDKRVHRHIHRQMLTKAKNDRFIYQKNEILKYQNSTYVLIRFNIRLLS